MTKQIFLKNGLLMRVHALFGMMKIALREISVVDLGALWLKWRIRRLVLFGSALSGQLGPESDIDLLAAFEPEEQWA